MKINMSFILLTTALMIQFVLSGCETQKSATDNAAEEPAPTAENRYGADGKILDPAEAGGEQKSRFGFNGADAEKKAEAATARKERDVREMARNERDSASQAVGEKKDKLKSTSPPKPSEYKYANKVAGDPLAVTLPGKYASLGKISIEKYDSSGQPTGQPLARGTPVRIPDPNNPGQKIYFKVP